MKIKYLYTLTLCLMFLLNSSLPVLSNSSETYDQILLSLEQKKEQTQQSNDTTSEPKAWTLTFEHDKLPKLDGIWLLSKKTVKRRINPVLTKSISQVHCNSRLPFEKRDILDKEVVISSQGSDFFAVNARYIATTDSFFDPNINTTIDYENFGFKAVIDPEDLTYSYTLKLKDFINNRTLARQLWLKGRLFYDSISSNRITAKGYEIEYAPECQGWVMDEIEFVLVKERDIKDAYSGAIARKLPVFEQSAYAAEVPNGPKLESAKDKSGIEVTSNYKPFDSTKSKNKTPLVPGMW